MVSDSGDIHARMTDNENTKVEKRIDELNNKCTQVLTFLSFAIAAAALIWIEGHNDAMRRPLELWVGAIFPTLIGVFPVKEIYEDSAKWYKAVRWSKVIVLWVAIILIFWGAVDFARAIARTSLSSVSNPLPGLNPQELETLKATLVADNRFAGWCTIAVFVGLVAEYAILPWIKGKKLPHWDRVLTSIAAIAIAGGVFGEYYFGSLASRDAMQIENISEQRVADSNAEAKKAEQRTAELEASLADRHLTSDQRKQMLAILKGTPGTKVMVAYLFNGDKDAQEYAIEIASVFRDAPGWTVLPPPPAVSSDLPVSGFAIQAQNNSIMSKLPLIEKVLAVTGYHVIRWPLKQGPDEIDIYIGRK
jgi:hypothetical protein